MYRLIILALLFSFNINADVNICYTQGDCQTHTGTSKKCFIASTGTDLYGEPSCSLRCIQVELGQYCQKINQEVFGYCRDELVPIVPIFNPSDPNRCDDAVEMFP